MACFEISNEIERRFYQEALSLDLKWRKQGLASLDRCCRMENAIGQVNNADPADPADPADLAILVRDIKVRVIQFDLGEIE